MASGADTLKSTGVKNLDSISVLLPMVGGSLNQPKEKEKSKLTIWEHHSEQTLGDLTERNLTDRNITDRFITDRIIAKDQPS